MFPMSFELPTTPIDVICPIWDNHMFWLAPECMLISLRSTMHRHFDMLSAYISVNQKHHIIFLCCKNYVDVSNVSAKVSQKHRSARWMCSVQEMLFCYVAIRLSSAHKQYGSKMWFNAGSSNCMTTDLTYSWRAVETNVSILTRQTDVHTKYIQKILVFNMKAECRLLIWSKIALLLSRS